MILSNLTNKILNVGMNIDNYITALIIFAISISILRIFKFVIIKKLKKIVERTETKYDDLLVDMVDKIGWPFYILISLYITFQYLDSEVGGIFADIKNVLYYTITIIAVYYVIRIIQALIDYGTKVTIEKKARDERDIDTSIIDLLSNILKGSLWIIAIIYILSNLGYNVTTLIAGLGVGGIAIAFALQNVLGDIFASFSIYLDRPFRTGDYIIFAEGQEGTVKHIGIKSTRIEALQGQEIVVSNKELTETIVHNYKRMDYRRVVFNFSVKYGTHVVNLEKIPDIIKEIISNIEKARFRRAHFFKFGDFGYDFQVVYLVNTGDYDKYMDVQQEINFAMKKRFEEEGIEIAYKFLHDVNNDDKNM